jgi:hypothetical protein
MVEEHGNHKQEGQRQGALKPVAIKQSNPTKAVIFIFLLFIIVVTVVFLTQKKVSINWIEDYDEGIKLSQQQGRPALLCFYKEHTRYSSQMWQGMYNRREIKAYVETHFVPILLDVDKQPEAAKLYNVTYYPTHFIKYPGDNKIDGPFLGSHRLFEFIKQVENWENKNSPQKRKQFDKMSPTQ